jgi:hypothetical protein
MRKIREEVTKIKSIMGVNEARKKKDPVTTNRTLEKPKKIPFWGKKMKDLINSQFPFCKKNNFPCVGKITDDDCITDIGVIGGEYSENNLGLSPHNWSVLNRFDTNSAVHDKIWEIYSETTDDISYENWIKNNLKDLFNGEHTSSLVDINKETISKGLHTETIAIKIIKTIWGERVSSITQHCAGDVRDRKKGQDLDAVIDGTSYYFQVKPIGPSVEEKIKKYDDERGAFYEVMSYDPSEKYKDEDVDVILYASSNESSPKYILFWNNLNKISTINRPRVHKYDRAPYYLIRYYEEPIEENLNLKVTQKPITQTKKPLGASKEKTMKYYQERAGFFQNLIDDLKNQNPE